MNGLLSLCLCSLKAMPIDIMEQIGWGTYKLLFYSIFQRYRHFLFFRTPWQIIIPNRNRSNSSYITLQSVMTHDNVQLYIIQRHNYKENKGYLKINEEVR